MTQIGFKTKHTSGDLTVFTSVDLEKREAVMKWTYRGEPVSTAREPFGPDFALETPEAVTAYLNAEIDVEGQGMMPYIKWMEGLNDALHATSGIALN